MLSLWLIPWCMPLFWSHGWGMLQHGLSLSWYHWRLPMTLCTDSLLDEILHSTQIWHFCWLQHIQPSSLAWCQSRCSRCSPVIHCTFGHFNWCISCTDPALVPPQPNNDYNHHQVQSIHWWCGNVWGQSQHLLCRAHKEGQKPTPLVEPTHPSFQWSNQLTEMLLHNIWLETR